jgi:Mce-associated membrane protein
MEGDAGSGRLNPKPPFDDAERSEAEETANQIPPADDDADSDAAEESVNKTPSVDDDPSADAAEPGDSPEAATETVAAEAMPQRSRLSGRWLAGVCAALLVLALAVGAGGYLALRANQKSEATARAEAAALAAAKDCVTATQAPDASAMEASQRKIIECGTGGFGAQATLYSGLLVDAYQAAKVQVQVSDMRAAVERHNDDGSMDVLVAMRVKVSNSETQGQEQGYRLRVKMTPDAGTYKIADLAQVSK